jgi:predicted transport protein
VLEDYTIEHILPQNVALSPEWQAELGPDWKEIQQTWLHTLGNLTLTGYNSEYSDYPFAYKRDQVTNGAGKRIGFKYSALNINEGLGEVVKWDENAIMARAERLAKVASKVWEAPLLDSSILDAYSLAVANTGQQYSIDDHPHLASGAVRTLFDALRQAILELDPCINEEYLKLYVAYKAETNFVDVVPQAKRLRLSLNMPFSEIDDPKGLCTDVTTLGRWGNGDVEIGLSSLEQLPYVMGLIRQSFDRQMSGPQDA